MRAFILAIGLLATVSVKAQSLPPEDTKKQPSPSGYVENMPSTDYDVKHYLADNIHYPDSARVHNIEGRVVVKFVVSEDGSVTDVEVVKNVNKECDEEALRVVKNMPRWKPGIQNGKAVKVYFTLPISFKLTD